MLLTTKRWKILRKYRLNEIKFFIHCRKMARCGFNLSKEKQKWRMRYAIEKCASCSGSICLLCERVNSNTDAAVATCDTNHSESFISNWNVLILLGLPNAIKRCISFMNLFVSRFWNIPFWEWSADKQIVLRLS